VYDLESMFHAVDDGWEGVVLNAFFIAFGLLILWVFFVDAAPAALVPDSWREIRDSFKTAKPPTP